MGPTEWIVLGVVVVLFLGVIGIAVIAMIVSAFRGKPKPKPAARIVASAPLQPQRSSMFDALDAGGPGAQAKIEGAMVDYAVREKLRQFSEATAPLMSAPAPAPVPNPPANPV